MITRDLWIRLIKDFHEGEVPEVIKRDIKIPTDIPIRRIISLIGPRRAGKTYRMFQLIRSLTKEGIAKSRVLYINFEDDRLIDLSTKDMRTMLNIFYEIYPENRATKVYLFLDEIQNVENWEKFVRSVMDTEKAQIFISGSSSVLLSKEIATSLRGRSLTYSIRPFSFTEILKAKNFYPKKFLSSSEKAKVLNYLNEYLHYGGYPEGVLFQQERGRIITEIFETTLYRDVIERHNIRNVKLTRIMLNYIFNSTTFSVNKLYNFLKTRGDRIGKDTLYNYFGYFCDSLVVYPLRKYSRSYKKVEQSLPKIYAISNGLLTFNGIVDKGRLMENLTFVELLHRGYVENKTLFYYRTKSGREIDFVVTKNKKVKQLIQVCYDPGDYETKDREIKALLKASEELNCKKLVVLTWDYEADEKIKSGRNTINFVPLWKFLLNIS